MAHPGFGNSDPWWFGLIYVVACIVIGLVGLLYFVPKYDCDPTCPANEGQSYEQ